MLAPPGRAWTAVVLTGVPEVVLAADLPVEDLPRRPRRGTHVRVGRETSASSIALIPPTPSNACCSAARPR
jgi:hypothetical protein